MFTNKELWCLWFGGLCFGFWFVWAFLGFTNNLSVVMTGYGFTFICWLLMMFPLWLSERERRKIRQRHI